MWPFTKKNYASPYYGKGNRALFTSPPMIPQQQDEAKTSAAAPSHSITTAKPAEPDWEQRRFELMKMLLAQERRSVVLGKLQATNKQIANTARVLADAGIRELMNHPMDMSYDTRREEDAQ